MYHGCQIFLVTIYQNDKNVPNGCKIPIPNGCKIYQIAKNIPTSSIVGKALQSLTKLEFLV
jgi:hypothetical protein